MERHDGPCSRATGGSPRQGGTARGRRPVRREGTERAVRGTGEPRMQETHGAMDAMAGSAEASRELMWNMGTLSHVLMYALMVVSFVIFGIGLARRIRFWKRGRPAGEPVGDWGRRLWILLRETFWQRQTRRRLLPGLFHSLIFYSFLVLFVTTLIVMVDMDFGLRIYHGPFYLGVTLAADLAGGLLLLGLVIAAVRRYLAKPGFLPPNQGVDAAVLLILGGIVLTGFVAEGARIALHPNGDPWRAYSPIGSLFAGLFAGADPGVGRPIHFATWWVHALGTFTLIALIPFTKFFHMLSIPTNQFLAKLAPAGSLQREDIEALFASDDIDEDFAIGVAEPRHLTWKQRLDLSACIDCGRCDDVCPVNCVDQPLSPRSLIKDLERLTEGSDADFRAAAQAASEGSSNDAAGAAGNSSTAAGGQPLPIIGAEDTVFADTEFIWYCRTCFACQNICPAGIWHVDQFMELRRAQVLMEGQLPTEAGRALKTMEAQGNPFGAQADRMDLVERLEIPIVGPGEETDVLFWIGCTTTFDPEKHKIAEDMIAIMKHLGVRFGHLGKDESCCGDPARVLGEENLFQATAKQTVEALQARKFQQLLVTCPHGYNVFKNEYPQFGGHFEVVHHTELLARWIREGRLKLTRPVEVRAAFHDPCYLGRYQGITAPPREILRALPGLDVRRFGREKQESFCCGAGGGHYWMDLDVGEADRVDNCRVREAQASGAETIAVGCPMCLQMLTDGLKQTDLDEKIRVREIVSLVREAAGI
ncbi:MAG: 4Fe-4S dicluster domain-containing protein [Candidatus Eisenbacteria bacterium]|nr:4Fe-4S dicluster domain-containing protein [Candidatus Eisenbacteria bacterium]